MVDLFPVRTIPVPILGPFAFHGQLHRLEVSGSPVKIGNAEANLLSFSTTLFIVVLNRPDLLSRLGHLIRLNEALRGIDSGQYHIIARIIKASGDFCWIEGLAR